MTRTPLAPLAAGLALLLAGCGPDPELMVDEGWVRLSPVEGRPAAAYFTLHGGPEDARLMNVTTAVAIRADLHETVSEGGMMQMEAIDGVDVPAEAEVRFEPGGKHVMLHNLNPGIGPGDRVPLIFTFTNGLRIQYDAVVRAAGDAAPAEEKIS